MAYFLGQQASFKRGTSKATAFAAWCKQGLSSPAQLIPLLQAANQLEARTLLALASARVRELICKQDADAIRASFDLMNWRDDEPQT